MEFDYAVLMDNLNVNLLLIVVYIGVLSAFVEGTVEFFKLPIRYLTGATSEKKIERLEKERWKHLQRAERFVDDQGLKEFYTKMADDTLVDIQTEWRSMLEVRGQRPIKWFNVFFPMAVGIGTVWIFYPLTLFSWLPFGPHIELFSIAISAVIVGRGANALHGGENKFSGLLQSLIGRIGGRF